MESRQANRRGGCQESGSFADASGIASPRRDSGDFGRACQERKQRCGRSSVSDGADDNANNASACQGQGRHWERARVESMDITHLGVLPLLIGFPRKSAEKPVTARVFDPLGFLMVFAPKKAKNRAVARFLAL